MTCYQRHLGWLFDSVGVSYEKPDRRDVHEALVGLLGLETDAHCPEVWAALKDRYGIDANSPSAELVADMQSQLGLQRP